MARAITRSEDVPLRDTSLSVEQQFVANILEILLHV